MEVAPSFAYGTVTLCGQTFLTCSATRAFCNFQAALRDGRAGPTTPITQRPQAFTQQVWAISPFARHYSGNRDFLSFPPGTQMCHFPGFPPPALCVQTGVTRYDPRRVSPFGDPCFIARLRLHTAYRSLPRPSSASGAKASTIRPYYLDGIDFALCSFQRPGAFALAGAAHTEKQGPKALKTEQQLLNLSSGRTLRQSWSKYPRARACGGELGSSHLLCADLDRSAVASLTCSLERR